MLYRTQPSGVSVCGVSVCHCTGCGQEVVIREVCSLLGVKIVNDPELIGLANDLPTGKK